MQPDHFPPACRAARALRSIGRNARRPILSKRSASHTTCPLEQRTMWWRYSRLGIWSKLVEDAALLSYSQQKKIRSKTHLPAPAPEPSPEQKHELARPPIIPTWGMCPQLLRGGRPSPPVPTPPADVRRRPRSGLAGSPARLARRSWKLATFASTPKAPDRSLNEHDDSSAAPHVTVGPGFFTYASSLQAGRAHIGRPAPIASTRASATTDGYSPRLRRPAAGM
ncbi:MAG: hypothetical protein QOI21_2126 [Actinomycetota bacterium]|nr:hypothetical protein [Actinomycetota bacterium]